MRGDKLLCIDSSLVEDRLDPGLLDVLLADHREAVFYLAQSILGDWALAEDVTHDVFLKAWPGLSTLRNPKATRSWLLMITRNTSISLLRTQRMTLVDPANLSLLCDHEMLNARDELEYRAQDKLALAEFYVALGRLDDLSQAVIVLREIRDFTYLEIAIELEVSLPMVKTKLFRARKRLAADLHSWE